MMLPKLRQEPWMVQALCAQVDPDLFYAEKSEWAKTVRAKMVCLGVDLPGVEKRPPCPVRAECLSYALENNEMHGVWGGMTPTQRKDARRLSRGDWRGLAS